MHHLPKLFLFLSILFISNTILADQYKIHYCECTQGWNRYYSVDLVVTDSSGYELSRKKIGNKAFKSNTFDGGRLDCEEYMTTLPICR